MDETVPLLRDDSLDHPVKSAQTDPNIVDFDPKGDPENPREWSNSYKRSIVALLAFTSFTVTFTCIGVVPVAGLIVADLSDGEPKKSASVLLVTIWELGEAAGPLLIAPLSEVFGRYPVINVCNVLFIGAIILAALSQNASLFITARALTGLAVASNVLNPAIVGDIFIEEERGSAMSLIMLAPLVGGAISPAISGAIAERANWRIALIANAILAGIAELLFLTSFRETYKVPILRRRAARLREETGNASLRTPFDSEKENDSRKFRDSILRPIIVFWGSSVLQVMALFGSMTFTYFYIMTTTLPDILQDIYGLTPAATGLSFLAFSFGSVFSIFGLNIFLDRIYVALRRRNKGVGRPEYRLPVTIFGALTMPLTVSAYGWVPQLRLPLPLLLGTLVLQGNLLMLAFLPVMAYVVDAFKLYAASSMTALIVVRCLMGTFLPLTIQPLVAKLGYGWAFTVLGGVSLALAPIPLVIFKYGHKWRQSSEYTRDEHED